MNEEKIVQIMRNLLNEKDKWDYEEKTIENGFKQTISVTSKNGDLM